MPGSSTPDADRWQETLSPHLPLDRDTYIVAHSLGCLSVLHYLNEHPEAHVGGLILVSGFEGTLSTFPELDGFIAANHFDRNTVKIIASQIAVFTGTNDEIVDTERSIALTEALDAPLHTLPNEGISWHPKELRHSPRSGRCCRNSSEVKDELSAKRIPRPSRCLISGPCKSKK